LAQDRDNPIERNEKKKRHDGQFPIQQMLNDEIENQFFLKKKGQTKEIVNSG
jgi:hypothetical protein